MDKSLHRDLIFSTYTADISPTINKDYTLHCHNFYEVYFFINGNIEYSVEGHHYHPAPYSMLLIAPNIFHGHAISGEGMYERYSCHFLPELLPQKIRELLLSPFHNEEIYLANLKHQQLAYYLDSLIDVVNLPAEIQDTALEGRLIALLSQIYSINKEPKSKQIKKTNEQFSIDNILEYIGENLEKKLTLDDICREFYISKNHLNRLFKAATGTTVNSYINYKRLTLARQFIMENQPATEAALNAGFGDYSNFYRTCRSILGVSPSELQSQNTFSVK